MTRLEFPRAALAGALALSALCLTASPAAAAGCKLDTGGGCEREGIACSPSSDAAPAAGKCYTVTQERVLKCLCLKTAPKKMQTSIPYDERNRGGYPTSGAVHPMPTGPMPPQPRMPMPPQPRP